jgi:hypothetical protein
MWQAREAMRDQGVRYAGATRHASSAARSGARIRGFYADDDAPPPDWHWKGIRRDIRGAGDDRSILSSEFLAHAGEDAIRSMIGDLERDRVQVVVTLRPIARMLSSLWQQRLQTGGSRTFESWLEVSLGRDGDLPDRPLWHQHHHGRLVERWAAAAGPERVTVVIADAADHGWLLRAFEGLLALRPGTLRLRDDFANRSLTLAEARAIRVLNQRLRDAGLNRNEVLHIVHNGAARYLKLRPPRPGEAAIRLPAWAADRAAALAVQVTEMIGASGVRVVGDLASLRDLPPVVDREAPDDGLVPADIAASMAMGVAAAAGMMRRSTLAGDHDRLAEANELAYLTRGDLLRIQGARARRYGPRVARQLRDRLG